MLAGLYLKAVFLQLLGLVKINRAAINVHYIYGQYLALAYYKRGYLGGGIGSEFFYLVNITWVSKFKIGNAIQTHLVSPSVPIQYKIAALAPIFQLKGVFKFPSGI